MNVLRALLFSPRLQYGFELWAAGQSALICLCAQMIGIFAVVVSIKRGFYVPGMPHITVIIAILSWFVFVRNYDVIPAGAMGFGGMLVFNGTLLLLHFEDLDRSFLSILLGFCMMLRFYSVGPMTQRNVR